MTIITLSDDQARILAGSPSPVIVMDPQGRPVGQIAPVRSTSRSEEEEIAEAKRRMADDNGQGRELRDIIQDLRRIAPP
ncbi:MAG TPA: hypothetical protein VF175_15030 [Lacipirellula sp.]